MIFYFHSVTSDQGRSQDFFLGRASKDAASCVTYVGGPGAQPPVGSRGVAPGGG